MLTFLNRPYPYNDHLIYNLKVVAGISLGMFLFFLFFQPIENIPFNFENRLLFYTGFPGIILFTFCLFRILIPSLFPRFFTASVWTLWRDIWLHGISWAFMSVAFVFYTRHVGLVPITFILTIKLVLLSLASIIIFVIINEFRRIRWHLLLLYRKNQLKGVPSHGQSIPRQSPLIRFPSSLKSEKLELPLEQVILVKAADNYIEVVWENDQKEIDRKLLRSSLAKTDRYLQSFPALIRCHRTYMINIERVEKLTGSTHNSQLHLKGYPEPIPVSRHYLFFVKEALKGILG